MLILLCVYLHSMYSLTSPSNMIIGEFGVVYRGKLLRKQGRNRPGFVAVKTMRGRKNTIMLECPNHGAHCM